MTNWCVIYGSHWRHLSVWLRVTDVRGSISWPVAMSRVYRFYLKHSSLSKLTQMVTLIPCVTEVLGSYLWQNNKCPQ
jgi:hypothetical protein